MRFPVHVNLVVVGIEAYKPEGLELGVIKTSEGLSLAGIELERGKKSSEIAFQLVKKYIDMESFDRNLFLFSPTGFIDAPNRYKIAGRTDDVFHQDIVLVYKAVVPLNTSLQNGMEWMVLEKDDERPNPFCKDHLNIIDMAFQHG